MLAIERRKKITSLIEEEHSVLVPELSKLFEVTEETIRRDLEKLEKEGILKKTYGGAILNDSTGVDLPLNVREITNTVVKELIALKVCENIVDGDTLILDSSSTAFQVAKGIKNKKNITVITNSVKVIMELSNIKDFRLISTGGILRDSSMSFIGHNAEKNISKYNVNKAIICCKGLDINKGIMESNEQEAEIKKAMINSAEKVYLLVDHTKFDRVSFVKMIDFEKINYIFTDKKLNLEWETVLSDNAVELIYCE